MAEGGRTVVLRPASSSKDDDVVFIDPLAFDMGFEAEDVFPSDEELSDDAIDGRHAFSTKQRLSKEAKSSASWSSIARLVNFIK